MSSVLSNNLHHSVKFIYCFQPLSVFPVRFWQIIFRIFPAAVHLQEIRASIAAQTHILAQNIIMAFYDVVVFIIQKIGATTVAQPHATVSNFIVLTFIALAIYIFQSAKQSNFLISLFSLSLIHFNSFPPISR